MISTRQLDETGIEDFTAVFLADPGRISDRAAVRLNQFMEGGGTVVVFPGDQTSLDDLKAVDFLPAKPVALRTLPIGRQPAKIVDPTHPLFLNAWDSNSPFPALPQQKMLEWTLTPETKVLVAVGVPVGLPLVIVGDHGAGRVVVINASADRSWGDLPLSPAFLPLVQQIARLSSTQAGRQTAFLVGDPLSVPAGLPHDKTLRLTLPDGSTRDVPPAAASHRVLERAEQPGIYTIAEGSQTAMFAVNVDRAESDLRPLAASDADKLAQSAGTVKQLVGIEALKQWLAQNRGMAPLWPILLVIALAIFAAEGILANIMARRRAQGDEKHIKTGRLNRRRLNTPFHAGVGNEMEAKP